MSSGGIDALELLRRARGGLGPTTSDAARVRQGVALAVGDAAPGGGETARPAPRGVEYGTRAATLGKLGLALALAATTGATGYVLGFRAGRAESAVSDARVTPAAPSASAGVAPLEHGADSERDREPRAPESVREHEPHAASHVASRAESAPATHSAPNASSSAPPTPAAGDERTGESTLELETRLLGRVEHALREDNPRLALGLLGELERSVPGGQLTEERQAARAVAHCELGSDSAPKLAADFAARYPGSAYLARVAQACAKAGAKEPPGEP